MRANWQWPAFGIIYVIIFFAVVVKYWQILGLDLSLIQISVFQSFLFLLVIIGVLITYANPPPGKTTFERGVIEIFCLLIFVLVASLTYGAVAAVAIFSTNVMSGGPIILSPLEAETAHTLFSSLFLAMIGILTIVTTFSIIIIQNENFKKTVEMIFPKFLLTLRFIIILNSITASLSFVTLVVVPSYPISLQTTNIESFTNATTFIIAVLYQDTIAVAAASIALMAVIFFEVVNSVRKVVESQRPRMST